MALNLSGTTRWQPIENYICNRHKISVNFATKNRDYVAAHRYVCKDKLLTDAGHSDMSKISSPVTKNEIKKFQSIAKKRRSSVTNTEKIPHPKNQKIVVKKKILTSCDVSYFMSKINIRKEHELM